jgi:long-chain fatty acid transport protein
LLAGTVLAGLASPLTQAQAGGFAIREQSTYFQGTVFAGSAAGGPSISSMFWNPATMTAAGPGVTFEAAVTGIFGNSRISADAATNAAVPGLLALGGSGNLSDPALVPASYTVFRPHPNWAFGISLNGGFGLITQPDTLWAGMFYSRRSSVFSMNMTPQVAYKVNDWLSVGAGFQMQFMHVRLEQAFPGSAGAGGFADPNSLSLRADGFGFGFTAGVTVTPTPWTSIGLGYRSQVDQDLVGDIFRPAFIVPPPPLLILVPGIQGEVTATLPLPDTATLSIRQRVSESLTLLGTIEWTNWSRFGVIPVNSNVAAAPGIPAALPFEWKDGWFYSVGAEYQYSPKLALRTGIAYEDSPITDRTRSTRLPDNDRIWVGVGLTYNWSEQLALEFGYSHIFVKDAPINITPGHPLFNPALGTFVGEGRTSVDIISLGLRYKMGVHAPLMTKG